jgi:hypothetical protein
LAAFKKIINFKNRLEEKREKKNLKRICLTGIVGDKVDEFDLNIVDPVGG